jgi:hypothetical protein
VSLLLHLGLAVGLLVTFSQKVDFVIDEIPIVPVDLVTVADRTNIAPMTTPEPATPPPEPALVEPAPPPDLQAPRIDIAPNEKPAPPKKAQSDVDKLIASLAEHPPANARTGPRNVKGAGEQSAMTADLRAILKSEIYRCWSPPVGSPHPEKLIVKFQLFLRRDGSVAQTPQLAADSAAAVMRDPYMRAAADAAQRAIYMCAPYSLPADRYNDWRDVQFTFYPADVLGQ